MGIWAPAKASGWVLPCLLDIWATHRVSSKVHMSPSKGTDMTKNMVGIATMVKVTGASFQELGGEWQGVGKSGTRRVGGEA